MKLIILVGGRGTRLFPLSRANYPKNLLKVFDNTSLLMQSIMRYAPITKPEDIIVVTREECEYYVRNELDSCGMSGAHIILEPDSRSTAVAIALALNYCKNELNCLDDETIFVSSSDNLISPTKVFLRNMKQGLSLINKNKIVLFGIKPERPEETYGYIKIGNKLDEGHIVEKLIEKPDSDLAQKFVSDNSYYWNCGIYLFQADTFWQEIKKHNPEIYSIANTPFANALDQFKSLPAISFKNDFLAKADNLAMVALNCFCDDVGSWDTMYEAMNKDEDGNAKQGDIITIDCENSLFIGKKRLITGVGLKDLLVVETDDVLLVAQKGKSDKVKDLVELLKKQNRPETKVTNTVYEEWGHFTILEHGKNFRTKHLVIKPGASLEKHRHYHRNEHWIVTEGSGKAIIDDKEQIVYKDQSVFVPLGSTHLLNNPGLVPLEVVAIQSGAYLEEDDIVTLEGK